MILQLYPTGRKKGERERTGERRKGQLIISANPKRKKEKGGQKGKEGKKGECEGLPAKTFATEISEKEGRPALFCCTCTGEGTMNHSAKRSEGRLLSDHLFSLLMGGKSFVKELRRVGGRGQATDSILIQHLLLSSRPGKQGGEKIRKKVK